MNIKENKLSAREGYVLQRISDGWIGGREIHLGYTYYEGGNKLAEPILELPKHYQEIEEPIEDNLEE